jgi:hypothetical protein
MSIKKSKHGGNHKYINFNWLTRKHPDPIRQASRNHENRRLCETMKLGFTNLTIVDIYPTSFRDKLIEYLEERRLVMVELLTKSPDETIWYENEQPIKEFLESFRKTEIIEADDQAEELSWIEIVKKSNQISF